MAEPAFTPGPWMAPINYAQSTCVNAGEELIALVYSTECSDGVTNLDANRRLIAAAPLMYSDAEFLCARLRELENELNDDHVARQFFGHVAPALARMEAALSLALGEKQDA